MENCWRLTLLNKTTRWSETCSKILSELWHWSPDSTWNVGQTQSSRCSHMTPRWLNARQQGWKWFSRNYLKKFHVLEGFDSVGRNQSCLISAPGRARRCVSERVLLFKQHRRMAVSCPLWLCGCAASDAFLHLCTVWLRIQQTQMEYLTNGSPRRTAGEKNGSQDDHRSDVCFHRRVAAVSSPALSAARLTLPGVMDAEGRVDESRLRMHIFKNGRSIYLKIYVLNDMQIPQIICFAPARSLWKHVVFLNTK